MGTSTWNGDFLEATYETRIGGKIVQLDSQVSSSEAPEITGILPPEGTNDECMDVENTLPIEETGYESPSNTIVDLSAWTGNRRLTDITIKSNQPPPVGKTDQSSNFYGKPTVKKSIGPL